LPQRQQQLTHWLQQRGLSGFQLEPASSDASFRRYFRLRFAAEGHTLIAMDAPPDKEDSQPFVAAARAFHDLGLNVPEVLDADLERGFVLLTDLGTEPYLAALAPETVQRLYGDALGALVVLQACGPGAYTPPPYDDGLLQREMDLFRDWYLQRHRAWRVSDSLARELERIFALLRANALEQPQVCVHRDYHSRNLMVTEANNPGILDFQDAVMGPVTYDLVSLLRDCYVAWPRDQVESWALGYHDLALQSGVLRDEDEERFLRWFDLMGVQRHLKAIGIFARLKHRDGKPGYLDDIPRTLGYVTEVSGRYRELAPLAELGAALLETDARDAAAP